MKTNKILAVIVNYSDNQLEYLDKVVSEFESFKDFEVDIIIHSNIELQILEQQYNNVKVNVIDDLAFADIAIKLDAKMDAGWKGSRPKGRQ